MISNFKSQISNLRWHIFTDFDGTITDTDSLVFLTRELGGGSAVLDSIGQQLRANTMTLRDGIAAEMATIRAPFSQAEELLRPESIFRWLCQGVTTENAVPLLLK